VGECSFWYRPTRVVPDQRPLNGRCCILKLNIGYRCVAITFANSQKLITLIGILDSTIIIILLKDQYMKFLILISRSLILQAENARDRDEVCLCVGAY